VVQCLPSKCKALSSNPQHKNISFLNYPFFFIFGPVFIPQYHKKNGGRKIMLKINSCFVA
jgi:hypothetical protein